MTCFMTSKLIIPARPDLLLEVQAILATPEPDMRKLIQLIRTDVSLYTVLLSTANSPLFRRQFLIESVEHAVSVLGISRVGNLIQAIALRSSIDPAGHWQRFWEVSEEMATLCHQLSTLLRCMSPESAYTLGMMHDIGVAVMRSNFDGYDVFCSELPSCNAAFTRRIERERYHLDRFEVAGQMAKEWYMADELVNALRLQAHAQAALMDKAEVSDEVKAANALLILAKDISQEYHRYWNFESRDSLNNLVRRSIDYFAISSDDYLDLKDDLVENLIVTEESLTEER